MTAAASLDPPETPATAAVPTLALADLPFGASAIVERVEALPGIAERLRDLGFLPGTRVTAWRRAPLGDPRVYELRGTRFCLRRSEAAGIRVRPSEPVAGTS